MLSIALALIPCVVVSFILNERENQLKHQQLVSGMSMTGYWASNTISDIIYAYVPIVLIIMLNAAFGLDTDYGWLFLMLYPPAVIPFSYMTSFMFSDDTTAQICTLFVHFIGGGIFTVVVYVLQLVPDTAMVGDALRYVGLVIPSFCVTHAFINSNELSQLVASRASAISGDYPQLPEWSDNPWAWMNLKADAVALALHFFVNLFIVATIESPVFEECKECSCMQKKIDRDEDLVLDDDVIDEEERVANMSILLRDTELENAVQTTRYQDVDDMNELNRQ